MQHLGFLQCIGYDTLAVHRYTDARHTAGGIDLADLAVARLLHGVHLVPTQKLDQQVVQKVGAGTD